MTVKPTPENKPKPSKRKRLVIAVCAVLIFCIALASAFFILKKIGEIKLKNSLVAGEKLETADETEEDIIYHNGKKYLYNEDLINLLLIGVDAEKDNKTSQGQADALYLVSVNDKSGKLKIISISRNTMCDYEVIGIDGSAYTTEHGQICLAYASANDDIKSSENCVKAVSDLLYGIPINGYYTIHLDSIETLVDAVGGVTVNITENDVDTVFYDKWGKTVTLDGDDAMHYIGARGNSNAPRVERHKEFIRGYINSAKRAVSKDLTLPLKLANEMKRYSVTDIDISSGVYLATEALNWSMEFVNIKGEYGIENEWETFNVDELELKNTVIDNFYIEK